MAPQLTCCCDMGKDDWTLDFKSSLYMPSAIVLYEPAGAGMEEFLPKGKKGVV